MVSPLPWGTVSVLSFAPHPMCHYFQFTSAHVTLPRCAWDSPGVHLLSQSQSLIVTLSLAKPSSLDGKLCMPLHLWSTHCVPDTVLSPGEMENDGPCPASKDVLVYWGSCSESHDLASQAAPAFQASCFCSYWPPPTTSTCADLPSSPGPA